MNRQWTTSITVASGRIDVLKGPSSALYGGGLGSPLGGLINIVSERPAMNWPAGESALRGGSYSTVDPYVDVNVPFSSKVRARFAGEYLNSGSWNDEIGATRWSAQPSVAFQFDPETSLLVQGQFNHRNQLEILRSACGTGACGTA